MPEEPPSFSHIILVTSNPYRIIPTLKSRCQVLPFSPVPKEEIQKALEAKGFQPEKAQIISLLVDGNLERALSLDWEEVRTQRNRAWSLFLALHKREKAASLLKDFSMSRGIIKEELEKTLEILASFCRDLILIKEQGDVGYLLNPDFEEDLREVARFIPLNQAMHFLSEMDFAIEALRRNLNMNIIISSLFSNNWERRYV